MVSNTSKMRENGGKRGFFGRFRRDSSGATAVEFAMVAPLFFLMLGVILETGLMLFSEYVLQNSVQNAARLVRTGQVSSADGTKLMTAAEFKTSICGTVSIIFDCDSKVTVYVNSANNFATLSSVVGNPVGQPVEGVVCERDTDQLGLRPIDEVPENPADSGGTLLGAGFGTISAASPARVIQVGMRFSF